MVRRDRLASAPGQAGRQRNACRHATRFTPQPWGTVFVGYWPNACDNRNIPELSNQTICSAPYRAENLSEYFRELSVGLAKGADSDFRYAVSACLGKAVAYGVRPKTTFARSLPKTQSPAHGMIAYLTHGAGQSAHPGIVFGSMDMRQITPTYFVSPQIDATDIADVAAAGITTVICNRPDAEVPPAYQADAIEAAALASGLAFVRLPLTHQTMNSENVGRHAQTIADSDGPVLAYCASGTRSTIVWALGQAGKMDVDDVLGAARSGGYDLDNLRPTLDAMAKTD